MPYVVSGEARKGKEELRRVRYGYNENPVAHDAAGRGRVNHGHGHGHGEAQRRSSAAQGRGTTVLFSFFFSPLPWPVRFNSRSESVQRRPSVGSGVWAQWASSEVGAGAEASEMTKEVDRVDDVLSQSETRYYNCRRRIKSESKISVQELSLSLLFSLFYFLFLPSLMSRTRK